MSKERIILDDSTRDDIIKNAWKVKPKPKKKPKPRKKPAKKSS